MQYYEDKYFYYIWKPHGLPTTFGINNSMLDEIETNPKYKTLFLIQSEFFDRKTEY